MKDEVLEFIQRRFPMDCSWLNGNCFFFAKILNTRFSGKIYYDTINGHFIFYRTCIDKNLNGYYDYSGRINPIETNLVEWDCYNDVDHFHCERIIRDCIL